MWPMIATSPAAAIQNAREYHGETNSPNGIGHIRSDVIHRASSMAANPFAPSSNRASTPGIFPKFRVTFVAPTLRLPTCRMSAPANSLTTRKLNGIEPIRYAATRSAATSTRAFYVLPVARRRRPERSEGLHGCGLSLARGSGERVAEGRVRGRLPSSAASRHLLPARGEKAYGVVASAV